MFTGIITDVGHIVAVERRGDLRLRIATAYDTASIDLGASIACSGACLTVVDKGADWFAVDVSTETQSRTAQGAWNEGTRLNLERALRVGDELGGHIVTGHVDGIGEIVAVTGEGGSTRITIEAPAAIAPYIAPKGSIALDGVSLTVNEVSDQPGGAVRFGINIIPHTSEMTNLGEIAPGRAVNLEIDVLARYLGRMEQLRSRIGPGITHVD
jgi:riboflavin synthase